MNPTPALHGRERLTTLWRNMDRRIGQPPEMILPEFDQIDDVSLDLDHLGALAHEAAGEERSW